MEKCIPAGTYKKSDDFMTKLLKIDAAPLVPSQHCYTHNRHCKLLGPDTDTDMEVAGLPCWDMSFAGKRLQEEGPTNTTFIYHAKRQTHKETPLIIIENTKAAQP